MTKKRIISAALTGNWGTKEINPNIPMSPEEIAQAAYEAWQAGASIVPVSYTHLDVYKRQKRGSTAGLAVCLVSKNTTS